MCLKHELFDVSLKVDLIASLNFKSVETGWQDETDTQMFNAHSSKVGKSGRPISSSN